MFYNALRSVPGFKKVRASLDFLLGSSNQSTHWGRVVMQQETEKLVESLQPSQLKVLEISGSYWQKTGFKEYKTVEYPEYDICEMILPETFDLIIADQVFEHLLWPYRAGKNAYQMLNPGGYLLISTPFLIRIHNYPTDCSRWTETGLKYFLAECGFPLENTKTGSWGNRACIQANWHEWAIYRSSLLQSLKNEPDFPFCVWALAQK
ncbi:MAG: methyltransferase domain-containing protein [Pseudanabaena sp. ELA607]|jgi:SAM-dependent methyltransferase